MSSYFWIDPSAGVASPEALAALSDGGAPRPLDRPLGAPSAKSNASAMCGRLGGLSGSIERQLLDRSTLVATKQPQPLRVHGLGERERP